MSYCDEHGTSDSCPDCMCESCTLKFTLSEVEPLVEKALRMSAEREDFLCDRNYRNGFISGWNSGFEKDEKALKKIHDRESTSSRLHRRISVSDVMGKDDE